MATEADGHPVVHNFDEEKFFPPDAIVERAHVQGMGIYKEMYERSVSDPESFWSEQADALTWHKKWSTPVCKWVNVM